MKNRIKRQLKKIDMKVVETMMQKVWMQKITKNWRTKTFFYFVNSYLFSSPFHVVLIKKYQKIKEKSDVETSVLILSQNFRPNRYIATLLGQQWINSMNSDWKVLKKICWICCFVHLHNIDTWRLVSLRVVRLWWDSPISFYLQGIRWWHGFFGKQLSVTFLLNSLEIRLLVSI